MSDPKPLSAEEHANRLRAMAHCLARHDGFDPDSIGVERARILDAAADSLDAERARADAAERRANAYELVLNEIAQEGCGCDEGIPYRCPSCRANDIDLNAHPKNAEVDIEGVRP